MRNIRTVILLCLLSPLFLWAQSGRDLRINEILVKNDSSYVDDFGQRSGWIEIFNTAYSPVDIGGMYLTDDPNNPRKYYIPKGDPRTVLSPRGYVVFFANNNPTHGILHLNFKLEEGGVVALYDANGRTPVDRMQIPLQCETDITYGRFTDGGDSLTSLEKATPKANNDTRQLVTSAEKFGEMDPFGGAMAMIAMGVVFASLALLYLVFKYIAKIYAIDLRALFTRKRMQDAATETKAVPLSDLQGEVAAAIAVALHLYQSQLHDIENTVLTIKKVSRTYSPWSSKIYGLRNLYK